MFIITSPSLSSASSLSTSSSPLSPSLSASSPSSSPSYQHCHSHYHHHRQRHLSHYHHHVHPHHHCHQQQQHLYPAEARGLKEHGDHMWQPEPRTDMLTSSLYQALPPGKVKFGTDLRETFNAQNVKKVDPDLPPFEVWKASKSQLSLRGVDQSEGMNLQLGVTTVLHPFIQKHLLKASQVFQVPRMCMHPRQGLTFREPTIWRREGSQCINRHRPEMLHNLSWRK